ncbi:MAG: carbohydrate-binding family 9-like protein [Verrucomicrobiota bacterium]
MLTHRSLFAPHLTGRLREIVLLAALFIPLREASIAADDLSGTNGITPLRYVCYRAATPLKIDGKPDEAAWNLAPWTEEFQDIEGPRKPKPRFRTRARMLWDDHYFYVAADMEEPHVWGTLTNHDAVIFHDNDFEVFIDPNGDTRDYYEFEINALNTGWDLLLKRTYIDGGPALNSWEIPGLKTAVHIRGTLNNPADKDEGWSVEMAFPWKALAEYAQRPAPPNDGDEWRVNFSRVEWQIKIVDGKYVKVPGTKEDNWVWSPQGVINMHVPQMWGFVRFANLVPKNPRPPDSPTRPRQKL